jgi:hypothetical protein
VCVPLRLSRFGAAATGSRFLARWIAFLLTGNPFAISLTEPGWVCPDRFLRDAALGFYAFVIDLLALMFPPLTYTENRPSALGIKLNLRRAL